MASGTDRGGSVREHRQTEESILRDDTRGDQIADDLWLAEVARQIPLIRKDLNECIDKLEKNDA